MEVRPRKIAAVQKMVGGQSPVVQPAQSYTFPAPIRGWILSENLATVQPAGARILDNWLCTTTGVRVRGGSVKYCTLTGPVKSLFAYNSTTDAFFAATASAIFTITAPGSPTTPLTATITGLTSGDFSAAQFGTAGGNFLYAVNGTDSAQLYDGSEIYPVNGATVNNLPFAFPSAPWAVGQVVTGETSGASATIVGIRQTGALTGVLRLGAITAGPFVSGEDITSPTSTLAIGRNFALRSQEFDAAVWAKTELTVTANAGLAPDGTATAERIVPTAVSSNHLASQSFATVTSGVSYTLSCYLKADGYGFARLSFGSSFPSNWMFLDLTTGALGLNSAFTGITVVNAGNGWWRLSGTLTANATGATQVAVYALNANSFTTFAGDTVSGVQAWGVQFEEGTVATPYEKTAAAVRTTMVAAATAASSVGSSIAITGVTTSLLSQVWSYANRLFFVQGGTTNAWYLPVDSIGGAANSFSLAGVFKKGGSLLFGATWSLDSGSGLDDKCVFVSTEGEVAVYTGTNPGSAADWALQGIYAMPKPLGKNAYTTAGGDLLIATEVGLIPISAAIQNDLAALESKAVSRNIAPYWQGQASSIGGSWQIVKAPRRGVMFISQPDPAGAEDTALAINLLTGAWSRCTGWATQCLGYFGDNPYFGAADSCVYLMDASGSDAGMPYTCTFLGQHDGMGAYGRQKTVRQMRAMFQTGSPINPRLSALANFREDVSSPPSSVANYTTDTWDSGLWDTAIWDADTTIVNEANWTATGVTGSTIAPELQLTFGVTPTPQVELVAIDAEYHVGAMVA